MDLSPWLDPATAGPLPPQDRAVYVESLYAFRHYGWAGQRALVTAETKLIDSTTPELYRRDDYAEAANRAADDPALVAALHERAAGVSARLAESGTAQGVQLDTEQQAQLEALGYVTAAANAPSDGDGFDRGLADPVSRLPVLRDVERARQAVRKGDLDVALERLEAVLKTDPGLVQPQQLRAQVLVRKGRVPEALAAFEALNAQTRSAGIEISVGSLKRDLGRTAEAQAHFEAALELEPYLDTAWRSYLRLLHQTGQQEALQDALVLVRDRRPDLGTAQVIAGLLALQRGGEGAEQALMAASAAHPQEPGARVALAGLARNRGELDTAARLLREELDLQRPAPAVRAALVEVLAAKKDYAGQLEQIDLLPAVVRVEPVMLHARAQALFNLGRYDDALVGCGACLQAAPESARCKLLEANVLNKLGRSAEARAALAEARRLKGLPPR
jgi:tetratricopeptide (TPR) repeat protein